MPKSTISATEAVRSFSKILNRARYKGDHYTIVRGGKPIAEIGPVETPRPPRTLGELPAVLASLPTLDPEDASFASDVAAVAAEQPPISRTPSWE